MYFNLRLKEKYILMKRRVKVLSLQFLLILVFTVNFMWTKTFKKWDKEWGGDINYFIPVPTLSWFDLVYSSKNLIFLKNGLNFDSLLKILSIQVFKQSLSITISTLDKYLIVFFTKKNIEFGLNNWKHVFIKAQKSNLSIFLLFWYTCLFFSLFFILI